MAVSSDPPNREVKTMSINITVELFGYTITLKVKRDSRHSGK